MAVEPGIKGSYQGGLKFSDVEYVIKSDLSADSGWIDIDPERVSIPEAALALKKARSIYFATEKAPDAMPLDIHHFESLDTVAGIAPPRGLGEVTAFENLGEYGDLILNSKKDITIKEVYLHPDVAHHKGLEEKQLRDSMKKGQTLRIRLMDSRGFWPHGGTCYGQINMPLPNRSKSAKVRYDPRTVGLNGKLHPAIRVLRWLIAHLPGSPRFILDVPVLNALPEPTAIQARFNKPFPIFLRLFLKYQLTLERQHDGRYFLSTKTKKIPKKLDAPLINRAYSLTRNYLPTAIRVVGEDVRRNITRTAVPVSHDLRGKIVDLTEFAESQGVDIPYVLS